MNKYSLDLRIPPAIVTLIFALAMIMVNFFIPATFSLPGGRIVWVIVFTCGGLAVGLAGMMAFYAHKTSANPLKPQEATTLVTTGIYQFSRNPMYLGILFLLCALALYLANGVSVLLLPGFVIYMNLFQIKPEEQALTQKFGDAYLNYTQRVRRWL